MGGCTAGNAPVIRKRLSYARVTTALALALAAAAVAAAVAGGGDAGEVDGVKVQRFDFAADGKQAKTFQFGDLILRSKCTSGGTMSLKVKTASDDASYFSYGSSSPDQFVPDFDTGNPESLPVTGQRDGVYRPASGPRVAIQYFPNNSDPLGGKFDCLLSGFAFIGNGSSGSGAASSVNGVRVRPIRYQADSPSSQETILKAGGLRLKADCTDGVLGLAVTTASDHASYAAYPDAPADSNFKQGESNSIATNYEQDLMYRSRDGGTAGAQLLSTDGNPTNDCIVSGIAWVKP
jgi:hypothetical protein